MGKMGMAKMIEASISEGCRSIEAGRGSYQYKLQMGAHECPLRTVQYVRRGPGVESRVRFFKSVAFLLDMAYYKVVFSRLAPHFPLLRRQLWPLWIRFSS
jgi:hypothetical protein